MTDWKNSATEPVLRLLAESGLALSAKSIVHNLNERLERPPSRATVHRSLSGALDAGLVHQPEGSLYAITDTGREYLAGNLSADDIELPDENPK
jgi:repressor of nif and glnA expression